MHGVARQPLGLSKRPPPGPQRAHDTNVIAVAPELPLPGVAVQETWTMPVHPSSDKLPAECDHEAPAAMAHAAGSVWPSARAERVDAKSRLAALARALEADVIPRLVGAHERDAPLAAHLEPKQIEAFVEQLRHGGDAELWSTVESLRRRGWSIAAVFTECFAPAARHLGELWVADRCDFATVTICLGRLQRLLRELSPAFGLEVEHPPNGRRILLAQHPHEQHSFGLSMVAEFFRREGWEVLGGVGGAVADPSAQVSREWFDAVGFSIGSQTRIDWLKERIAQVRKATRNRGVVVMVGGPLFVAEPSWAHSVGADASGTDGSKSPALAEQLLVARLVRR
jgi:MerR family transcriptional regulator, light-induced transcriptional regulator